MSVVRTTLIHGQAIPYTLVRRRGYHKIGLSVQGGRGIRVTTGKSIPLSVVERFVTQHHDWIHHALSQVPGAMHQDIHARRTHYREHKERARALIEHELTQLNRHYGFAYGRVSIRQTTSRWGSCSSKKNLNFSYRVLFLPPPLREYVLVHELCHLQEMNHSPAFWALVAQTVPDYHKRRHALRRQSLV